MISYGMGQRNFLMMKMKLENLAKSIMMMPQSISMQFLHSTM